MSNFNRSYVGLRRDLLKYIPKGNHIVLDLGCATGINGKYLLDELMAKEVYGVEFDEFMALEATKHNTKVFCGDLNNSSFVQDILDLPVNFDFIICGDILEHLYDPNDLVEKLVLKLKKDGRLIISLPNIAHVELFIQVFIKGTWPRNERGIFDATHLRWFTKKDVFEMVKNAKLNVEIYEPKLRARDAIGSKFNWKTKLIKRINRDWVTFQHIIVCTHG